MAEITASMVKELRERTQAGMSDCKSALVEAGGDMEKAVEVILKKGLVKAAARAGRVASEGEVRTNVTADGKRGTIVEVNCQTDFVSRGEEFKSFVGKVLEVASKLPKGGDLLAAKFPGTDQTVEDARKAMVGKTGENTVVRRWDMVEARGAHGLVHAYVHMGGKLAVLIEAEAPHAEGKTNEQFKNFVDNSAMQIAAMSPMVVKKDSIEAHHVEKQKEIYAAQLKEEGKPEQAWPKIIEGKVNKWFTEVTLLGQESVTDPGKTVDAIKNDLSKALGGDVHIHGFIRYGLGEGVETGPKDDLAAEVAKMTGG
jgi:elongation factor Ts